jgi:phenylpropionate dioxygenase-like ring-hydroxylating dioxygenase large terminal subunit
MGRMMNNSVTLGTPCTFDPENWQVLARHWYPIAQSAEVGPAPYKAMLLDQPLVAYRVHGELVVARDVCPHRGVPLTLGTHDAEGIVCAYHGLRYGTGGRCNRIPADPEQRIPGSFRLTTYQAVERYGLIWVCLAPVSDSAPDIPLMPHWDDADFQQIICPRFDVRGSAGRQLEGFIDVAHFAWIHTATFADPERPQVSRYTTVETPHGFHADYYSQIGNYPIGAGGRAPAEFEWLRHFEVHLPFTATLTIHFPAGARLVIMNAASPVSARHTRLFAPIARNFDKHLPVEDAHAYNLQIFEEDRRIVESQTPPHLPLDVSAELHISADASSIAYRRGLKRLGLN